MGCRISGALRIIVIVLISSNECTYIFIWRTNVIYGVNDDKHHIIILYTIYQTKSSILLCSDPVTPKLKTLRYFRHKANVPMNIPYTYFRFYL